MTAPVPWSGSAYWSVIIFISLPTKGNFKILVKNTDRFFKSANKDRFRVFLKYTEKNPKAEEWNELMSTFQRKSPQASPEMWWMPIKLVFDSEWF